MMEETKHLLRQVRGLLVAVAVVLFALLLAMQIQLQQRNDDIDTMRAAVTNTRDAAHRAETAAKKTSSDVAAAIAASGDGIDTQAVVKALEEIHSVLVLVQNLDSYIRNTG